MQIQGQNSFINKSKTAQSSNIALINKTSGLIGLKHFKLKIGWEVRNEGYFKWKVKKSLIFSFIFSNIWSLFVWFRTLVNLNKLKENIKSSKIFLQKFSAIISPWELTEIMVNDSFYSSKENSEIIAEGFVQKTDWKEF